MLIPIADVLTAEQVVTARQHLDQAEWGGRPRDRRPPVGHDQGQYAIAGGVPGGPPVGRDDSLRAGKKSSCSSPPLCPHTCSRPCSIVIRGQAFGTHVDNAIRQVTGTSHRIRTDLSATLFLAGPEEYDGGELVIEDTYGTHEVKLPAGHLILYPATSLHHVTPVTRGARIASFFWIQSMIRDDGERTILFDLDVAIQRLNGEAPGHPSAVQLTGIYHNLLRRWSEL